MNLRLTVRLKKALTISIVIPAKAGIQVLGDRVASMNPLLAKEGARGRLLPAHSKTSSDPSFVRRGTLASRRLPRQMHEW
jgi:hypothetical protein